MTSKSQGKIIFKFPDDINTDDIIPAWTLQESTDRKFFKKYAFANYDPTFVEKCRNEKFNIVIAGENFGCGSSREQAVYALQENNIIAVIAKSFPDIFYRNALNNGLLLIVLPDVSMFKIKDKLTIDLENRKITINDKETISFEIDDQEAKTFALGGKIGRVRKHLKKLIFSNSETTPKKSYFATSRRRPDRLPPDECYIKIKPQTIGEKIISDHVGKRVFAEEFLEKLPIDILFLNEVIAPPAIKQFYDFFFHTYKKNGMKISVFNRKQIFLVPDHAVPSPSITVSHAIAYMKKFAKDQNIKCYKQGDGIEHVILAEDGYIVPGKIILGTDSHADTNGAFNTLAFGVGTTDASFALATFHLYDFTVPKTIRVNLRGKFQKGVYAKDLILHLIGKLDVDGASKQIVEFGGTSFSDLSIDARTTISNMVVEMGGRTAIFEYDDVLKNYIGKRAKFSYKGYLPDENCHYENVINIDLSTLEPCIAFPHKPSNVTFISKIAGYMKKSKKSKSRDFANVTSLKITDAFLGACTNGRYDDFVEAAKILKGRKVHPEVNFIAIPASRKVYNKLLTEGILEIFSKAGVNIQSSTCGPCFGKQMGVIGKGAQMISSSNRNYIGRMGSADAKIFLASPVTVAAAAIAGKIIDPRKYL